MLPWNEVFGLQFSARARCEAHAKVRQALVPGTGYAHLFGTILRRKLRNRVEVAGGEFRPEKHQSSVKCPSFFDAALDPQFVNALLLPVGKQTYAVPAGFDFVKVVLQLT